MQSAEAAYAQRARYDQCWWSRVWQTLFREANDEHQWLAEENHRKSFERAIEWQSKAIRGGNGTMREINRNCEHCYGQAGRASFSGASCSRALKNYENDSFGDFLSGAFLIVHGVMCARMISHTLFSCHRDNCERTLVESIVDNQRVGQQPWD